MNRKDRRAASKSGTELQRLMAFASDCHSRGDLAGAVSAYARIVALAPNLADVHFNLGVALKGLGRLDEAITAYSRAVTLRPTDAFALSNLGTALLAVGRDADALAAYRRAVAADPTYAEAGFNLGTTLHGLDHYDEAAAVLRRVVAQRPAWAEARDALNQAQALLARQVIIDGIQAFDASDSAQAASCFRRAAALDPTRPDALANLGHALRDLGDFDGALNACRRALAVDPEYPEAHYNLGMALLQLGDLAQGWREHEWRWRVAGARHRTLAEPAWAGESLAGRTLFLYGEQGFGDVLQFVRFAPLLAAQGARVVLEVQDALAPLVASIGGGVDVIGASQAPPAFDIHAPLLTIPGLLGTTLEGLPAATPYLSVSPDLVARWATRLPRDGHRIGIVWQGNPRAKADLGRSIPLALFAPLGEIPSVRLISLQKAHGLDQIDGTVPVTRLEGYDQGDFQDTAALIMALDLVITSDTSVAHLAGALGRPVWIVLKHVPDWRWLLERTDSPWYPTARLFRQKVRGDWPGVFAEIAAALRARIELG